MPAADRRDIWAAFRRGVAAAPSGLGVVVVFIPGAHTFRKPEGATADSLAKNLLHGLALGKLIDELVQLANLPHQRILDLLHADTADHAFDQ